MKKELSNREHFICRYGSYDQIDRRIGSSDEYDKAIAEHKDIHKDHEDLLKDHDSLVVKRNIAERTSDPELINSYSKNVDPYVAKGIIFNPHASSDHLENIVSHHKSVMRDHDYLKMIQHPNASKEFMVKFSDNTYPTTYLNKTHANKRLETGDYKE